ncbi:hypothetical protein [Comamonas sp. JNW]|uniref:hypothetical protein n=1 Tax=Comamonas sp. JNW TaxID=2170731 RepID=UPI0010583654|nr:hypothetical protein [Comamonas sp. JNW]
MTFKNTEKNLVFILNEIENQREISKSFPEDMLGFDETIARIHEYIEEAGEYALAYELMVILLETYDFTISGLGAVKLLELGLIMKFKTTREIDSRFNFENC